MINNRFAPQITKIIQLDGVESKMKKENFLKAVSVAGIHENVQFFLSSKAGFALRPKSSESFFTSIIEGSVDGDLFSFKCSGFEANYSIEISEIQIISFG